MAEPSTRVASLTTVGTSKATATVVSAGVATAAVLVAVAGYVADLAALVAFGTASPVGCRGNHGAVTRDVSRLSASIAGLFLLWLGTITTWMR